MKKSILLFAFAVILTSCARFMDSNEGYSTSMSNIIEVQAMVGSNVATRATFPGDVSTTTEALNSFNLSAWQSAGVTSLKNISYVKGGSGFAPASGTYYWSTGKYSFIAWAKNNAAAKASEIFNTGATESMTSVTGRYKVENSVKDTQKSPAVQNDPILAVTNMEKPQTGNKVDLNFQHLLSRISINLYAPLYKDNTVCLLDFGFENVDTAGTFTYTISDGSVTSDAFAATCWSGQSSGNVGEFVSGTTDPNTKYWWPAYTGSTVATVLTEGNRETYCDNYAPIVPKVLDKVFDKFTIYTTTGENPKVHTAAGSAPWLNVIPGEGIADNLQIRIQIKQKETGESDTTWHVKKLNVSLADLKIAGTDTKLSKYNPGYQYVYNVRISGQNTEDAKTDTAKIQIVNVSVQPWNTQTVAEQSSTDIKIGKSLQNLVDEIESKGGYGTILLSENVNLDTTVFLHANKNSDITIDLNGYDIAGRNGKKLGKMFEVANGASLSIVDSAENPKDTITAAQNDTIVKVLSGGKAIIYDGVFKISGANGSVIDNAGTASVKGGTFLMDSGSKTFTGTTTKILSGGTYIGGYVPADEAIATGYEKTQTSEDPVTYKIVQSGEKVSINNPGSGNVTAD